MRTTVIILIYMIMCNTLMHPSEDPFSVEQERAEIRALHHNLTKRMALKKTPRNEMVNLPIAQRLPLLTQYMPASSNILRMAQENVYNRQPSGIGTLKRCDYLEGLLRLQSQTSTLLYDFAEPDYCPSVLINYWDWIIRKMGIITEEERLRLYIAGTLMPDDMGFRAQHPDSRVFWDAYYALNRDAENELEHFKHAIRTIQQKQ